ncbi:MAG: helix-turn-helix transcriptional regulator [Defluviitaleaceae bacterium]|nr:helix-turn-helix transcriptional regulator [Defluviitaleaceae bacterium]
MAVSYNRLWKMLIDKKMKKMDFAKEVGFSGATLSKLGNDEYVALSVLDKICQRMECRIEDIVEVVPDAPSDD